MLTISPINIPKSIRMARQAMNVTRHGIKSVSGEKRRKDLDLVH